MEITVLMGVLHHPAAIAIVLRRFTAQITFAAVMAPPSLAVIVIALARRRFTARVGCAVVRHLHSRVVSVRAIARRRFIAQVGRAAVKARIKPVVLVHAPALLRVIVQIIIATVTDRSRVVHAIARQRFTVMRITVSAVTIAITVFIFVRGDIFVLAVAVRALDVLRLRAGQRHVRNRILVTKRMKAGSVKIASTDGERKSKNADSGACSLYSFHMR